MKSMTFRSQKLFVFPLAILLLMTSAWAFDSLICREHAIAGLEQELATGHKFVGGPTSDVSEMKVYVTPTLTGLYVQSNYLTQGFENPTKIRTDEHIDLLTIGWNLVNDIPKDQYRNEFSKIRFYFDQRIFGSTFSYLATNLRGDFRVVDSANTARVARNIHLLNNHDKTIVEYLPSVYLGTNDLAVAGQLAQLSSVPFRASDVRLLTLTENTATRDAINSLIPDSNILPFDLSSSANLREILLRNRGKKVFVLGHVEAADFVTRDALGNEKFRLSQADLDQLSKDTGAIIFPLGCNSAKFGGPGVANTFNTVDAVNRFHNALQASTNGGFLESLAGPDLSLIIDPSLLQTVSKEGKLSFGLYQGIEAGSGSRPSKVGTLIVPLAMVLASALGSGGSDSAGNGTGGKNNPGSDSGFPYGTVIFIGVLAIGGIWVLRKVIS